MESFRFVGSDNKMFFQKKQEDTLGGNPGRFILQLALLEVADRLARSVWPYRRDY